MKFLRRSKKTTDQSKVPLHVQTQKREVQPVETPTYKQLRPEKKEIRVLILRQGVFGTEIQGHLRTVTLPDAEREEFDALSYVWGDDSDRKTIKLNGLPFSITRNAEDTLQHMRLGDQDRLVWMDSICINQRDNVEKSSQVAMMSDIYKAAAKVFAFVGQDTDGSAAKAMQMLLRVSRDMIRSTQIYRRGGDLGVDINAPLTGSSASMIRDPPFNHPDWQCLATFFRRRWFERVWIVQEANLAKKAFVLCGTSGLSWDVIGTTAFWMTHNRIAHFTNLPTLDIVAHVANTYSAKKSSFSQVLMRTSNQEATDARDYIYGVLGLVKDFDGCQGRYPPELQPDYSKSVAEVFIDSTKWTIRNDKDLTLLSMADANRTLDEGYPSWVPRWDQIRKKPKTRSFLPGTTPSDMSENEKRAHPGFKASGSRVLSIDNTVSRSILSLMGVKIGVIKQRSEMMKLENMVAPYAKDDLGKAIKSIWGTYLDKDAKYPTGEDILKAYSLTMCANRGLYDGPAHSDSTHFGDFASYFSESPYGVNSDEVTIDQLFSVMQNNGAEGFGRYRNMVVNACYLRRFCTTDRGYMGLCNPATREGDFIYLLYGGLTPYILRRVDNGMFTYIGACYVHGMMYGEGLELARKEGIREERVKIA